MAGRTRRVPAAGRAVRPPVPGAVTSEAGVKARVEPFRARVQRASSPALTHLHAVYVPSRRKRRRAHGRRPLFVLANARRRRARSSLRRGGYYAFSAAKKPRSVPRPVSWMAGMLGFLALWILGLAGLLGLGGWFAYAYIAKDLPSVDNIHSIGFESTRIYDRNGNLIYQLYDPNQGKRTYVSIQQMPKSLIDATIAVEDQSFEANSGVDPMGIVRAVYINLTKQGQSGASTITQQLVRRVLLPEGDEQTWLRKIREAILATQVTDKYSKEQILEIYLNEIYYGSLSYGVAAASETYFGKKVEDLNLAESAMLAGLPQSPSQYDLNVNFDLAKARQKIVLDLMVKSKKITPAEADAAYQVDVHPVAQPPHVPTEAPHFVQYVEQVLEEKYGPDAAERGGLRVITTIDPQIQTMAEQAAAQQIDNLRKQGASNAAVVVINPRTGEILAMVGSVDFHNPLFGQVNVATALRQPGSSFKPFTYATAFEQGDYNPDSILPDLPVQFPDGSGHSYVPLNYDLRFHGPVTVRSALANSFNIPAVEMLNFVGIPAVLDTAHRMGITTLNDPKRYGLSLTLGGGEVKLLDMTSAYGTFADYGYHVPATPFLAVVDSSGKTLYELNRDKPDSTQVIDSGVAYQITSILSDNVARTPEFGANSPLKIDGLQAAVKTGTTNDWKDSWTVGYTRALVVGVWVGNNDNKPMAHVAGAIGAAPIWHNVLASVYKDKKMLSVLMLPGESDVPRDFPIPSDMVQRPICDLSGMMPTNACIHVTYDWFAPSDVPKQPDTWHKWIPVTLHDNGASIAGPGVPISDTIERVFVVPPPQFKQYYGGGPPTHVLTISDTADLPLPTPVRAEPPPVSSLVTPVADIGQDPAGGSLPDPPNPIDGLAISITSPAAGSAVSGPVAIFGQADATDFGLYRLEYGRSSVDTMTVIVESQAPPLGGLMAIWNTSGLPSGPYVLRLTVQTKGGEVVRRDVPVRIGSGVASVSVQSPSDGAALYEGEATNIDVHADGGGADIAGVEIYVDGKRLVSLLQPPWSARWTVQQGPHEISAKLLTGDGQQVTSGIVHINSAGLRPTPTPTLAPIIWISNFTENEQVGAGVRDVWVDVSPNSPVKHVDIYIDGIPAGYATGPGYRVNPAWSPTPTPRPTEPPPPTLDYSAAATATWVAATAQAKQAAHAAATATRLARANAAAATRAAQAQATEESLDATATSVAATTSPTPAPPTATPSPQATPTFVRYSKLPDPMLGDYVAQCQFTPGNHRIVAIGYDSDNNEVGRDETWITVESSALLLAP